MVERSYSIAKVDDVRYFGYAVVAVQVSLGDTITLAKFDSSKDLSHTLLVKKSDGTEISCSIAISVVTGGRRGRTWITIYLRSDGKSPRLKEWRRKDQPLIFSLNRTA